MDPSDWQVATLPTFHKRNDYRYAPQLMKREPLKVRWLKVVPASKRGKKKGLVEV